MGIALPSMGRAPSYSAGAFHYFSCPKALWPERFEKIKEAGFNAVETYVPWNWSEREKPNGLSDTSHIDLKDLDDFLTMAEDKYGLYLNGQPLGRYWEVGPQRAYFLPSTMLKDENVLEYTAKPGKLGDRIKAAQLRPLPMVE
jgi:hypothetical protein